MNVPMTQTDPLDSKEVLIRLYEQAILPPPDWLNSEAGVIQMLRICLGDFASALTLNEPIFDSCLQLIFRQALDTLPQPPANFNEEKTFDTSTIKETQLTKECHLHLMREYLDQKDLQKSSEAIAAKGQ